MSKVSLNPLKTEAIYGNLIPSAKVMEKRIFEYIELWYNKKRRHSHLGYLNIDEFEQLIKINKAA